MSEQKKRPAHEVILEVLAENVRLQTRPDRVKNFVIRQFCQVLTRMHIPEEHRAEVAGKLWEYKSQSEAKGFVATSKKLGETSDLIAKESKSNDSE